jgi:prepilin-type processing-associated H-X9-DG protein
MRRSSEEVSMTNKDKTPKVIDDKELDEATGGLLAAQKLEDKTTTESTSSSHSGGVNTVFCDGSVRFVS